MAASIERMDSFPNIVSPVASDGTAAMYELIKENRHLQPVRSMCKMLRVSPSGYYDWMRRAPSARARSDALLLTHIVRIFESSGNTYGARRIHRALMKMGLSCGLHRVERLMRAAKLKAACPTYRSQWESAALA